MANRLAYVANSTMWPMWLIAEKSLLQLSGTLQTRFSQRNFNRATHVPSGSHSKGHTVHHYSHITSLLPSTMWPVWLIAEKAFCNCLEPSKLDLAKEISTGLPRRYLLEAIPRIIQFITILILPRYSSFF